MVPDPSQTHSPLVTGASPDDAPSSHGTSRRERLCGYAVHFYTASGILPAYLAAAEIFSPVCDPRWVFGWLLVSVAIDSTDGPLARAWHVKRTAPLIDGRTIDDLLDYLTFSFIPLLLVARMEWLPEGTNWTVAIAMGASLWGFAHSGAKEEDAGFFRGFPSYWNIYAFYAGILTTAVSPWLSAILMWVLTVATVAPIRMVYPNLAPRPWRMPVLIGAVLWTLVVITMVLTYPRFPLWVFWLSLVYPMFYTVLSLWLDFRSRQRAKR